MQYVELAAHGVQKRPNAGSLAKEGRILVAQLGPNEFLLTGIGGAVFFHRPGMLTGIRMQILTAEEGYYTPAERPQDPDVWHVTRILNGDQTDRGIRFLDPSERPTSAAEGQAVPANPPSPRGGSAVRIVLSRF